MEYINAREYAKMEELVGRSAGRFVVHQTLYIKTANGLEKFVERGSAIDSYELANLCRAYKDNKVYLLSAYEVSK